MKPFRPMQRTTISMTHPQTSRPCMRRSLRWRPINASPSTCSNSGNVLEGGGAGKRKICVGIESSGAPGHQVAAEATATDEPNDVTATRELIDTLVECATPVRRLRPPLVRAMLWLAFAGIVLALIAVGHGVRTDLPAHLIEPKFAASSGAALAASILATIAAFIISLPDRSRWWLLLPLPALAMSITTIGYGCLADWVSLGPDGARFGQEIRCFALLILTSVPLALALAAMLRYAALLRGGAVAMV